MLLHDDWENYIIESSRTPQLAAVERQITTVPQIHVHPGRGADAFRRELWLSTTNGEYPTMNYRASQNPANVEAMRTWFKLMSDTRHWEFEPYFDVDGARAVGLDNVSDMFFMPNNLARLKSRFPRKHKYNPRWINPRTGEVTDLKDVKQDAYSVTTPGTGRLGLWSFPGDGQKEAMLKSTDSNRLSFHPGRRSEPEEHPVWRSHDRREIRSPRPKPVAFTRENQEAQWSHSGNAIYVGPA